MEVIKTWLTDQIRSYEIKIWPNICKMLHARQITYVYKRNQRLDSMHRYETLAMDEMQKDFLGFSNRQAC
jgi:hypothetical protein